MNAGLPLAVAFVLMTAIPAMAREMAPTEEAAYTALMALDAAAQSHFHAGDLVAAETLFRQQLDIINRDLPDAPLTLAATLNSLAATLGEAGRRGCCHIHHAGPAFAAVGPSGARRSGLPRGAEPVG